MPVTKEAIIASALALNEADRRDLWIQLAASLDEPVDIPLEQEWDTEIDRRLDNVNKGQAAFLSWEEARRRTAGDTDPTRT